MSNRWRGIAGITLAASCMLGGTAVNAHPAPAAPTPAPQALAYVTNNQVTVFEAGTLTTVGPGQSPDWSPNGVNLLYMRPDFVANLADVYIANTHGANSQRVLGSAYPYVNPTWSPDSHYIVYAAVPKGATTNGATIQLQAQAYNLATKQTKLLGQFSLTTGCSPNGTALQTTMTTAQGAYHGTPSTLIWAQPNLVIVQSSCTGQGLTMFKVGGKPTSLAGWSAGVLSPDGKTVAAAIAVAGGSPRVGLIAVASGKTQVLKAAVSANALTWTHDGKALIALAEPSNPATGSVLVTRLTPDGKTITKLSSIRAAGAFHPSVDLTDQSLAVAVVASASAKVAAPPTTTIDLVSTLKADPVRPFFVGSQPAWRP